MPVVLWNGMNPDGTITGPLKPLNEAPVWKEAAFPPSDGGFGLVAAEAPSEVDAGGLGYWVVRIRAES